MNVDNSAENSNLLRTMAARHTKALYPLALKKTLDQADAWDLIQDVYERALKRKPDVADDEALRAWLTVVLRNAFIDRRRTPAIRRGYVDLEALPTPELDQGQLWRNVGIDVIEQLGEELIPSSRDVFRLHLKGLPVRGIATELGIRTATVSRRLFRARREIRERICATYVHA